MSWYQPLFAPFPAPTPRWRNVWISLAFGGFIFSFLYAFQPFGLYEASYVEHLPTMLVFGAIPSSMTLLFLVGLPALFPAAFGTRWQGWHQLLYLGTLLLLLATLNGLYINRLEQLPFRWLNYGRIILWTASLAALPLLIMVLADANLALRTNLAAAAAITPSLGEAPTPGGVFTLPGGETMAAEDLLYAQAFGNYVKVYYQTEQGVDYHLVRSTLADLTKQLTAAGGLRCHRSFLVNCGQVSRVTGNAQGLRLFFGPSDHPVVPVARSYVAAVRSHLTHSLG